MTISKTHIILYVQDQVSSTKNYSDLLLLKPVLNVPGMTEFELGNSVVLGLMPNDSIAKIITPTLPHPQNGTGIPRCELYLYVEDLDLVYERTKELPFKLISPLENRNWGDRAFYLADQDGHVIAFAERIVNV